MGGACPDMVEGCSHDPGLSDGLVMVRGGWVRRGTWSPRFSVGNRAPRRNRSQATAQNHQDPLTFDDLRALALPPGACQHQQQYLPVMTLNASIIAPGFEGSQLPAPPRKLVPTQTANGGGEGQPLAA